MTTIKDRIRLELESAYEEANSKRLWTLASDLLNLVREDDLYQAAGKSINWAWLIFPFEYSTTVESIVHTFPNFAVEDTMQAMAVRSLHDQFGLDVTVDECEFTHPIIHGNSFRITIKGIKS